MLTALLELALPSSMQTPESAAFLEDIEQGIAVARDQFHAEKIVNHPHRPQPGEGISIEFALKDSLHIVYFCLMEKQEGRCRVCSKAAERDAPLHLHRARPGVNASAHPIRAEDWILVCCGCHPAAEAVLLERYGASLYGCCDVGLHDEGGDAVAD
jgi:hypothetical protein